ncbi:serine/threonine protein kinase [Streptomyces phaeochromogenes]|jgi:eukaryotic-like serine/threonine-protein kinase|uniref:protein kinase domain-containing protein n=1 Tax=Streptomyces phaeochromogenes TaxID=1923 RepID=UPI0027943F23|nr:protein kinase [Streptomyces phaeochromogenes]MDQ0950501.1 serine/threonine protein kinase [Streptomyces phaeochromogenes]
MDGLDPADPGWIGGYRLLGRLGEGGMGRVYLARSERGRTVAVKVVKEELARTPDFRRRFAQEVKAAQRVGGEWTAPVLDADTEAPTPWVATGYVAGPSLAEVVDKQYGPLPPNSVRALAIGLIRALQAIHGAGLVHRDLKPSNVLVTIDGPRVIDFGIARALDTAVQSADGLTRTGALVGSPGFMAPEQVRGERVTFASDVFCLGALLAYTVTGRLPFGTAEGGIHSLLFRIAEEEADLEGIPESWQGLIAACLAKDPAQRPSLETLLASVEEMPGAPGGREGRGGAWLPGEVLAELGRHAVRLLDSEDPQSPVPTPGPVPGSSPPVQIPGPAPASSPIPGFGPPLAYSPTAPSWQSPPPGSLHPQSPLPGGFHPHSPPPGHLQAPHFSAPAHGSRPTTPRSTRGLSIALAILLALFVVPLLLRTAVLAVAYSRLSAAASTSATDLIEDYKYLSVASLGTEVLTVFVGIAVVIVWAFWFQRSRFNAEAFEPGRVRHASGMAAGSWFIPVVNLYMPKQIGNDIWTATTGRPAGAGRWRLHMWWWFWLAYFLAYANDSWASWYDRDLAVAATDTIVTSQAANFIGIVTAVLAILFVRRLTNLQQARIEGVPGPREAATARMSAAEA